MGLTFFRTITNLFTSGTLFQILGRTTQGIGTFDGRRSGRSRFFHFFANFLMHFPIMSLAIFGTITDLFTLRTLFQIFGRTTQRIITFDMRDRGGG